MLVRLGNNDNDDNDNDDLVSTNITITKAVKRFLISSKWFTLTETL